MLKGPIKSIFYPYYVVGSHIINIETLQHFNFKRKIQKIAEFAILTLTCVVTDKIYEFQELVLDYCNETSLVLTASGIFALPKHDLTISEILKIRPIVVEMNEFRERNPIRGQCGYIDASLTIITNFNAISINGKVQSTDCGLVYSIARRNELVAFGCDDRSVRLLNVKTGQWTSTFTDARVWKVLLSTNIIVGSEDGSIRIYDVNFNLLNIMRGHGSRNVWALQHSKYLYSGGSDGGLRKWNPDIRATELLPTLPKEIKTFAITPNGILVLYRDGQFVNNGQILYENTRFGKQPIMKFNGILVCGNMLGELLVSDLIEFKVHQVSTSRITGIFFLKDILLVVSDRVREYTVTNLCLNFVKEYEFPNDMVVMSIAKIEDDLILGFRNGSVMYRGKVIPRVHGVDAVTSIAVKNDIITTVGRDGFMRKSDLQLNLLSESRISKGWLESIAHDKIVGFWDKNLFVYDTTNDVEIFKVHCGGGHRVWDMVVNGNDVHLAWYKDKEIYQYRGSFWLGQRLVSAFHQSECRAVTVHQDKILTVGEDSFMNCLGFDLEKKWAIRVTGGSLKCISTFGDFILIGGSEQHLSLYSYNEKKRIAEAPRIGDLEVRVMACSLVPFEDGLFCVSANSDGNLLFWKYSDHKFEFLHKENIHNCCAQKVTIISHLGIIYGLSGGTNGLLHFWKYDGEFHRISSNKICQSGIKAFDFKLSGDDFVALIGGDDCSLSYLNLTNNSKISTIMHSSAVAGCAIVEDGFISVGVDERLIRFDVDLKIKKCEMVDISDVQDLSLTRHGVVVAGQGIQIFENFLDKSN